jgi:uncharacterized membrane protein YjjP (DUF1212 family)
MKNDSCNDDHVAKARVASADDIGLISRCAKLLFDNGQTTNATLDSVRRLADAGGFQATVFPRLDSLTIRIVDGSGSRYEIAAVGPVNVDMHKVVAVGRVVDEVCERRLDPKAALATLERIARFTPVPVAVFAFMAGAGAAALGVIFGSAHLITLLSIAASASAGACLRRWLAAISPNPFVQPLCAALLAGVVGAFAVRFGLSSELRLVAVCPCMVLVPGPHVLNGALDLARGRIALGISRIVYASLILLMISIGLLIGLSFGNVTLPVSAPSAPVPLAYDLVAAGVAVAAYGTFFAMPWRMLPIPIIVGMLAHAARWAMISASIVGVVGGAFVACLIVGTIITPIVDRLRLPFGALAFASVVSLIPGVFIFRMAGGLVELINLGDKAPLDLIINTVADGTNAALITLAISFGLIFPKLCIEHFYPKSAVTAASA